MMSLIVDIIGIVGFLISLINVIYCIICNRKKLVFNFGNYGVESHIKNQKLFIIYYRVDNLSQKPISITRIQLSINDSLFESEPRPHKAEEQFWSKGDRVYHEIITDTKVLPINLDSLASESGYIAFAIPQDISLTPEKSLTFRICTNRGRAFQKTFLPHEDMRCP